MGETFSRRVLVLAYYFPPMGLSGVQRTLKFVKYLPDYGFEPTVLTCEPRGYFAYDAELLEEVEEAGIDVVRARSWDPTMLFGQRSVVTLPEERRRRRLTSISQFLFVPDNKVGWIGPAAREARRLMKKAPFDVIFSTAPPYSAHLLGRRLSRKTGLPLVLDFRDDWLGNPRHVYPTAIHHALSRMLERRALSSSRRIVVINEEMRQNLLSRNADLLRPHDVVVIPQGFDPADFPSPPAEVKVGRSAPDGKFTLLYSGVFYDAQTPDYFLRALADLFARRSDLRTRIRAVFLGLVPEESRKLARELGVDEVLEFEGYLAHSRSVERLRGADVLWMTVGRREGAETISTSKLFEYFGSRKPILGLVPDGAARSALERYRAAEIVDPNGIPEIAAAIERLYEKWISKSLPAPPEDVVIQFDRTKLAERLAEVLESSIRETSQHVKLVSSALNF